MTAKDLLYKILDYQYLWSLPQNKNSKPANLRLEQIEALLDAFGLTKKYVNPLVQIKYSIVGDKESLDRARHLNKLTNLDYVLKGEFLHDREENGNAVLSEKIRETIILLYPFMKEDINERPVNISWLYNNLFLFRKEVYKLIYPNEGMLEGFSAGLHYSFYLQNNLKKLIKDNLNEIDETLWLILDPAKRDIEMNTLVSQYKYVDHDFRKIDFDWQMENY
ncbi:hypothetical protein [Flavobacterium cerinum]|uniref:Uncharacterized protein n=1 Tax=Flavobacterium cerinum TaxID=2502784 RepID=A0ABY5ITQ7_9FLAO|nr:hypothetical protein [Flavobacterium cerinum]UUC44749.1 hypothetical protein NOX80_14060 [Flavobacterium cerinum]